MPNSVFIATSIDGYIADKAGGLAWLDEIPNPEKSDCGYIEFMTNIDAIVMGRKTFESISDIAVNWPYTKPVYVLSNTLNELPDKYKDKIKLIRGDVSEILLTVQNDGYQRLYIDGGITIQAFLQESNIDELIVTTIPIILGGGTPLFATTEIAIRYKLISSKVLLGQLVQNHYRLIATRVG